MSLDSGRGNIRKEPLAWLGKMTRVANDNTAAFPETVASLGDLRGLVERGSKKYLEMTAYVTKLRRERPQAINRFKVDAQLHIMAADSPRDTLQLILSSDERDWENNTSECVAYVERMHEHVLTLIQQGQRVPGDAAAAMMMYRKALNEKS